MSDVGVVLQAPDAVTPLAESTPGVQGLLKLFGSDPGSTPLGWRLRQLRPSFEAILAPISAALSAHVRLAADVHLATLDTSSAPRMAFKASQV